MRQNFSSNYKPKFILIISANGILDYAFFPDYSSAYQRLEQEYQSFCEIQSIESQDEHWIDDRSCYASVETKFGTAARLSGEIAEIPS